MIITVPPQAAPGYYGPGGTVRLPALCDLYAAKGLPPSAWLAISVTPKAGTTVTPDASGRFLHCLFRWSQPVTMKGQRREILLAPDGQQQQQEIFVETDPGTYRVGSNAGVELLGGVPDDQYEVQITAFVTRREHTRAEVEEGYAAVDVFEPAAKIELTSVFFISDSDTGGWYDFPAAPQYHTYFEVVQGNSRIVLAAGNVPLDASYGPGGRVPLNMPRIQIQTGIYKTTMEL